MSDLVERLRTTRLLSQRNIVTMQMEAAEAIEARDAEIARLREALRPFARCADDIDYDDKCRSENEGGSFVTPDAEWAKFRLTVKDYRRARAALTAKDTHDPQ